MAERYFAAANSAGGFVSWYDEIFSPESLDRTVILKGGSGTGKSTLMKRAAARGLNAGWMCEFFHCSSDPDSLDGVILRKGERSFGILDGTPPHVREPRYPGACEEIVNLGQFWEPSILREKRGEIVPLVRQKAALFADAFEYLYACGEIEKLLFADAARFLLAEKLRKAAGRLMRQLLHKNRGAAVGFSVQVRGLSAISTHGLARFDSFAENEPVACRVADVMGSAPFFFDALLDAAKEADVPVVRAPMPLEPSLTEALRFPTLGAAFVTSDGGVPSGDGKVVNMARFIDREKVTKDDRVRRRLLKRSSRDLLDASLAKLAEARAVHEAIERIYIEAMDFDFLEVYAESLLDGLFS